MNLANIVSFLLNIYMYNRTERLLIITVTAFVASGKSDSIEIVQIKLYKQRKAKVYNDTTAALQDYELGGEEIEWSRREGESSQFPSGHFPLVWLHTRSIPVTSDFNKL